MKPNLFDYATSELSQDAFLAWIIKWADKEFNGQPMNECGRKIVSKLSNGKIPEAEIYCVKIYQQYEISNKQRMDLWITFNEDENDTQEKYSLVIEDKVDTTIHDSQLKNYRKEAEEWCKQYEITSSYCYYKSGFLSAEEKNQIEKIYSKGNWFAFSVYDILPILKKYTENSIVEDYVNKYDAKKIDLENITDCKDDLYRKIINAFEQNEFLVDNIRKEGNQFGVYASKNERKYWAGYWKNPDKFHHCLYISCSANQKEIDKLNTPKSKNFEFELEDKNKDFPCVFYISDNFYKDFNGATAEAQESMLSDLIKEIDELISNSTN